VTDQASSPDARTGTETSAVRLAVLGGSAPATVQLVDALAAWPGAKKARLELVLHGRSADRLAAVAGASERRAQALGLTVVVTAQADRQAALEAADIVLNQIRPGGLEQRSADESFPHQFGLPGEETLGPGGFASAIRSVAALRPVWADVARCCPDALLINLTNPAGIVTQAARLEHGLDVIAVCDSPLDLLAGAAARLAEQASGAALRARYVGMNHVGWYVPSSAAELEQLDGLVPAFDPGLPRLHGALPGPYMRYYAHPDRMLAAQQGQPTRADQLRELADSTLATFGRGDIPAAWRRPAPWYSLAVVPLIDSWLMAPGPTLILGLPNRGRLGWLPDDVIVEGPATVQVRRQPEGLPVVELPDLPRGILARHASYERLAATTLAAGPPADEDMHKILLANPMVTSLDQARALTGAIISRMSASDPQWR
jgi:6-phospho-beta-glucosidase